MASQSVSLAWDPNSETNLAGYVIYYGTASGQYSSSNNVGNATNTTVAGLQEGGNYYFVVTAYDASGLESDPSNEVNYQVPSSGPTISGLSNQVTLEDTPKVVSFTVSRGTNLAGPLSVTALSSDSALVPAANIVVTGSLSNYTATLTPRPNAFGLATITMLVSNGTQSSSSSFLLTVTPVNDAPALDPIGNLAILEDAGLQSVALAGISSGAANESQTLTLTAVSSNPSLIPAPTFVYTTPSPTGTLRFTPAPNASGSATITVTLNDGQGSNNVTTRSFTVSVAAVNDVPTISNIPNQQTPANNPTAQIPFIIQDIDSLNVNVSASSSDSTLLPTANIVFGGTGSNRTVQLTPAPGQSGQSSIILGVTDGLLTATTTFMLTVTPSNGAPTISAISSQATLEDTSKAVTFTVAPGTNSPGALNLAALSSDGVLVPVTSIVFSGGGSNYTATLSPRPNAFGPTTVTIVASYGTQTASSSFVLTVNPVNDAPTLNPIGNVAIAEDAGLQSIALSGISSGATNESQTLTITAVSSNPSLVPAPAITYTSPNPTGTLRFTPLTNANGSATITVTVNDGQASNNITTQAFTVSVATVNDAPTISSIPNQQTAVNSATPQIPFVVHDIDSPGLTLSASSSNPTLLPIANILFSGTGSNRTAQLTPAPGQSGQSSVGITVTDGSSTATTLFTLTVASFNSAPTLNPIGNVAILEDAGVQSIALSGISSGATNESQTLTITAVSSNPSVIPAPAITYTSPNPTGTLRFAPRTNANGSATITVTVNDGQASNNITTQAFTVSVAAVNDAPTISSIPNQQTGANSPPPRIPFVIQDVDSLPLTLTAFSSNPTLLPTANILFSGTGSNRTVQLTPASGQAGQSSIVIAVSDGVLAVTTTYTLIVTPYNAVPTISSIPNQATDFNTALASIPVIVGDTETPAAGLSLSASSSNPTLLPAANISFGGNGSNRTMFITPVADRVGTVVISVAVHDGNSAASTSFQLTLGRPQSTLVVSRTGMGTVTPDLNGRSLTVGQSYTLTAMPGAGQVFAGWGGGITSGVASLKFQMTANLLLEAKFMTNPYTPLKGTYTGLFHEADEVRHERSGLLNLVTTSRGTYSGRVRVGSHSYALSGHLDIGRRATNTVRRTGTNALTVELELAGGSSGDHVSGRVTDGNWVSGLLGDRSMFHAVTNRASFAGSYTLILPEDVSTLEGPGGDGFGTVSVSPGGNVLLKGRTADGTALTQTVPISLHGEWPLYVSLYGGKGSMLGWLMFTNRATDDITGLLSWLRPGIPAARYYPGGFTNETQIIGSSYIPPATRTNRIMTLTNGVVALTGAGLPEALTNRVFLRMDNQVLNMSDNRLAMTLTTRSGLFKGSETDPATGKTLTFQGVLLQKRNAGSGYFLGTNQSGRAYFGF